MGHLRDHCPSLRRNNQGRRIHGTSRRSQRGPKKALPSGFAMILHLVSPVVAACDCFKDANGTRCKAAWFFYECSITPKEAKLDEHVALLVRGATLRYKKPKPAAGWRRVPTLNHLQARGDSDHRPTRKAPIDASYTRKPRHKQATSKHPRIQRGRRTGLLRIEDRLPVG
jgi:hypothetical protein